MAVSSDNSTLSALILFTCYISKMSLSSYTLGLWEFFMVFFFILKKIFLTSGESPSVLAPANAYDSKGLRATTGALLCVR